MAWRAAIECLSHAAALLCAFWQLQQAQMDAEDATKQEQLQMMVRLWGMGMLQSRTLTWVVSMNGGAAQRALISPLLLCQEMCCWTG